MWAWWFVPDSHFNSLCGHQMGHRDDSVKTRWVVGNDSGLLQSLIRWGANRSCPGVVPALEEVSTDCDLEHRYGSGNAPCPTPTRFQSGKKAKSRLRLTGRDSGTPSLVSGLCQLSCCLYGMEGPWPYHCATDYHTGLLQQWNYVNWT